MILQAIVLVKRKNGFFYLNRRNVFKQYDPRFTLKRKKIQAVHPGSGWGVALIFRSSQVDRDFGYPVWFPDHTHQMDLYRLSDELKRIAIDLGDAFLESDERTYRMLGRGWTVGPRPYGRISE